MSECEVNLRDAIQALLTAYEKGVGPLDKAHMDYALAASPSVVCALLVELDDARLDAKRYQWLRSRVPGSDYRIMGVVYSEGGSGVDAAIDAALARHEDKP